MIRKRIEQSIYWSSIYYDVHFGKKSIHVLGYPKTGTNWMCNLLSAYYGVPVLESWNEKHPILSQRVFHLHRFFHSEKVKGRLIYMARDGRDAIVSRYFMVQNIDRQANVRIKERFEIYCGRKMNDQNVKELLPHFIKFFFEEEKSGSINYNQHIEKALAQNLFVIKYEELLKEKEKTLARCIAYISGEESVVTEKIKQAIEANDFKKLKSKKANNNSVFLRKGIAGDWKNHFTSESATIFKELGGQALIDSGYEVDHSWVLKFKEQ